MKNDFLRELTHSLATNIYRKVFRRTSCMSAFLLEYNIKGWLMLDIEESTR